LHVVPVGALSGSDWRAGRIMDDSVFYNKSSMSVDQIQEFLNSKVPTCDTNGTQIYSGSQTRAQYSTSQGYPPPYTCLKDYKENPTTHENNLSGNPVPAGAQSAATIIWNAAQQYNINPQVLIVLLQKEQGLVLDSWPWTIQFRSATGYSCPDGGSCDSQYYGFYNQVTSAAWQFRRYATFPNNYNYIAGHNNTIKWFPNSTCGSSTVFIENTATAGLYDYTPYQPNAAALSDLNGSGDACSSHGNRNFWRDFTRWFGSTLADDKLKESPATKAGEGGGNAASWNVGRLDLFIQGTNTTGPNMWLKWYDSSSGWSDYQQDPPGEETTRIASQVSAVSWEPGRIDIFARSETGTLLHKWYQRYMGWSHWEDLGGCIIGAPSATSWGVGRLDIFVQGCNDTGLNEYHKWYDGSWHNWELVPNMNARITAAPSAVSWGPNRIDIFARGEGADLIHDWYGGQWFGIDSQGGCIIGQPVTAAWKPGRLDVFVQDCNNSGPNVSHKWYDNNSWRSWEGTPQQQTNRITTMLGAVSWGNNRIDIFARAQDGTLIHQWYDGGWNPWESLAGGVAP